MQTKTTPNMTREIRKELRAINTQIRRALRDQIQHQRTTERAIAKIENAAVKQIRTTKRESATLDRGTIKQLAALNKRRDILIGRLS